jgi:hypothetical protein
VAGLSPCYYWKELVIPELVCKSQRFNSKWSCTRVGVRKGGADEETSTFAGNLSIIRHLTGTVVTLSEDIIFLVFQAFTLIVVVVKNLG